MLISGALAPPVDPARVRRKIAWRILPFVFLLYMIAYLDRANVAFVKLSMTADLRFSEGVFGLGAGIFTSDVSGAVRAIRDVSTPPP